MRPVPPITRLDAALVVHDMQNDFIGEKRLSDPSMMSLVDRVRSLIDVVRAMSMTVIYTRVENDPRLRLDDARGPYINPHITGRPRCVKGTNGAEIIDELTPGPDDFVITKVRYGSFYGTPLDRLLRVKGIWILVVVGGSLNNGIETLLREALSRDIATVVVRDCTYSNSPEDQTASLRNVERFLGCAIGAEELTRLLKEAARR